MKIKKGARCQDCFKIVDTIDIGDKNYCENCLIELSKEIKNYNDLTEFINEKINECFRQFKEAWCDHFDIVHKMSTMEKLNSDYLALAKQKNETVNILREIIKEKEINRNEN